MTTVNTRRAAHRALRFDSLSALEAELDRIETGLAAGAVRTTGNWSVGQICEHLGKFVRCSYDGFDGQAPWVLRVVATALFKRSAMGKGAMPRGLRLPKKAEAMLPAPGVSDAEGLAMLLGQLARIRSGEQMTHHSPVFGSLTHEQWVHLHLKHAAMHLGFVEYPVHG